MAGGPVLALDISGSRAFLAVVREGRVAERVEVANPGREAAGYWPVVRRGAVALARRHGAEAVGVSFGGPVGNDGRIRSIHVGGWSELDPAGELSSELGVPAVIENDANCGAVGEARYGTWGTVHTLVFLTCSTGIGGGILSDGRLLRGTRGLAGELGHLCVRPDGPDCPCGGRGCLEVMCCGTAIARRATEALAGGDSALAGTLVDGRVPGAREVFAAAAEGDPLASRVLAEVWADFGRGVAGIHNALDPDLIVIGGGVSLAGPALTVPVAAAARPYLMASRRDHLRLEAASRGLDAQLLGAACLATEGQ